MSCVQHNCLVTTAIAPDHSMICRHPPAKICCPTLQGNRRIEPGPWLEAEEVLHRAELERTGLPSPPLPYLPPSPLLGRSTSAGRFGELDLQPSDVPGVESRLPHYLEHAMVGSSTPWCSSPALAAPHDS